MVPVVPFYDLFPNSIRVDNSIDGFRGGGQGFTRWSPRPTSTPCIYEDVYELVQHFLIIDISQGPFPGVAVDCFGVLGYDWEFAKLL